ncbi:Dolichyl-phosphate-mannose-protein mannosyltransferase-domain-containing protein [Globomyces pollinis-pini]|nr:Dolichyl-phosphate-mannose-protein mannosyltransferase-domain-containing protein [Globomyces pollinis-pini]
MSELKQRKRDRSNSPEKNIINTTNSNSKIVNQKNYDLYYDIAFYTLSLIAFITRAWLIHHPGEVVFVLFFINSSFDEVHFGKFASFYLRNEYYFDVHPPLGKLLLAGVGAIVGYDGHFLFDKIGDNYAEHNVPYLAFRLWSCLCGAAVIPVAFLILKEMGVSLVACCFGCILLIFDTALTTQSRLILLDSMLMLFCTLAIYFWIKFYKQRYSPFSLKWWFWLAMTGVGLALVLGVKLVGLFTVATVGIATLFDLWDLLDVNRKLPMKTFINHFSARALCLIVLPMMLYLVPFYIHFALLTKSGPGDAFMSLAFQEGLIGNSKTLGSTEIPLTSEVTIQHMGTNFYLHSHLHRYPLHHVDGKVSSQGQQVNGYGHSDQNSVWELEPIDPSLYPDTYPETGDELRYLRHGTLVRLKHKNTTSYLVTHDVASPLTTTNMEVTTFEGDQALERYNETIWRIDNAEDKEGKILSKKTSIKIINVQYNVALHTHPEQLPDWGFKMQEMNGNKKISEHSNNFLFQTVKHSTIPEIDMENLPTPKSTMSFLQKFVELQSKMIHHNNALTATHPYSSVPISWPFVIRGISFWEKKEGWKQIYLLGNPFAWWLCILGPLLYICMWVIDRVLLRRGIDDFGPAVRTYWDRSIGFMLLAWALHWFPFFLMGRMLFLHHYLPCYIFATITTTLLFDFLGRSFNRNLSSLAKQTRFYRWHGHQGSLGYHVVVITMSIVTVLFFWYFSPLCYGTGFPDVETLRTRKWFPTWDLQYA